MQPSAAAILLGATFEAPNAGLSFLWQNYGATFEAPCQFVKFFNDLEGPLRES